MLPRVRFPCAARFLHDETQRLCWGFALFKGGYDFCRRDVSAAATHHSACGRIRSLERRRLTHAVSRLWLRWVTFREGMPAGLPNNNCSACKLGCSQLQRYHTWYTDALPLLAVLVRAEQRPSRRGYASRRCPSPLSLQLQRTV